MLDKSLQESLDLLKKKYACVDDNSDFTPPTITESNSEEVRVIKVLNEIFDFNFKDSLVNLRDAINKRITAIDKAEKLGSITNKHEVLQDIFRKLFDSSNDKKTAISYQELTTIVANFSKEKFEKEIIEFVLGKFGIKTREKNGRTTRVTYDNCRIYGYAIPKLKLLYNYQNDIKELINAINTRVIKTHPPLKSLCFNKIENVEILSMVDESKNMKLESPSFSCWE